MAFQKVEFTFPDEQENKKPDIEIEKSFNLLISMLVKIKYKKAISIIK